MTSFLIEYHRKTGERKITRFQGPAGRAQALTARLDADFKRRDSDVEYVVVESASEAELRRTHRRYFETLPDLIASMPTEVAMAAKFELYMDAEGKFRFRLKAANGEVIAASEAYESRSSAMNGIESIRRSAAKAAVVDHTGHAA